MKHKSRFDKNFTTLMLGVAVIGIVIGITGCFLE